MSYTAAFRKNGKYLCSVKVTGDTPEEAYARAREYAITEGIEYDELELVESQGKRVLDTVKCDLPNWAEKNDPEELAKCSGEVKPHQGLDNVVTHLCEFHTKEVEDNDTAYLDDMDDLEAWDA